MALLRRSIPEKGVEKADQRFMWEGGQRPCKGNDEEMTQTSLLEVVAAHETTLLAEVSATEEKASAIVETAQSKATQLRTESHGKLEAELAELRRKGAEDRERERLEIDAATAAKVQAIRKASKDRRVAVAKEMLEFVLPEGYTPGNSGIAE